MSNLAELCIYCLIALELLRISAAVYAVVQEKKKHKSIEAMVAAIEAEQAKVTTTEVKVPKKAPAKKPAVKKTPSKKSSK